MAIVTPAKLIAKLDSDARRAASGYAAAPVGRGPRVLACMLEARLTADGRVTWMLGGQRVARARIAKQIHT